MDFQCLKVNLDMPCQYIFTFVYHLAHITFLAFITTHSHNQFMYHGNDIGSHSR